MIYIHTFFWLLYFVGYLIFMTPSNIYMWYLTKKGRIQERDQYINRIIYKWARRMMKAGGAKMEVQGVENIPKDTPVLFTPNHQGMYDVPAMITGLDAPHGLVAKKEALKYPVLRTWMKYLHCVFIDRENPREAVKALNETAENIKNGYSMVIFPEGTRARCDTLNEFKHGAFKVAKKCGCPIVPVCIDGTYRIMEANGGIKMKPGKFKVTIFEPIDVNALSKEEFKELPQKVHDMIQAQIGK